MVTGLKHPTARPTERLFHLAFEPHAGAESEEKREPASDIHTAVVDSLKVLDPERPIREADMGHGSQVPISDSYTARKAAHALLQQEMLFGRSPLQFCGHR